MLEWAVGLTRVRDGRQERGHAEGAAHTVVSSGEIWTAVFLVGSKLTA